MKNFKSIGGKNTEINIPSSGMVLIQGRNGTGKTTLFSAINFGLYGKNSDVKGESKTSISASELVNDINKKEMLVEVTLDSGHTIRRGISPDIFEIIDKDGVNLADKSSKVIDQQFLEQELLGGMNYAMFHKLVYISAKSISTPFLYLTPSQRKEFIEHILDIRILYYIGEVIKKKQSELKLDIKTVSDKLSLLTSSILSEENSIKNMKERREQQIKQLEEMKANKQSLIDSSNQRIHELKVQRSSEHTTFQFIEIDIENIKRDIAEMQTKLQDGLQLQKQLFEKQINDKKQEMMRRKNERDVFYKNLEGFKECGTCSTLKTIVGEFDDEAYTKFIEDSKSFITTTVSGLQQIETEIKYNDSIKEKIIEKQSDLKDLEYKFKTAQLKMGELTIQIEKEEKLIESLQSQLDTVKPIDIDESHLQSLLKQQTEIAESHDKLIVKQEQYENIKKRVSDKTIKRELLEYYIPIFEQKINELLSVFMEDDPFTFSIKLTEDFDIEGSKNGRKANIFKFSEGQKASINFAFVMAIQYLLQMKNSQSFGLLAIDEILDSALDESRLDKIIKHLVEVGKEKPVMIISHNPAIQTEYFDMVIQVKTEHNFSTYSMS